MMMFSDAYGQLTPQSEFGSNFELIISFMVVLITCKNEEDQIKNEGISVSTALYIDFQTPMGS